MCIIIEDGELQFAKQNMSIFTQAKQIGRG